MSSNNFDVTPLGIDEVIKHAQESHALYVTNNSGQRYDSFLENADGSRGGMVKQTLGLVHVSYRNAANELMSIAVPNTWVPINLAAYAQVDLLVNSENLRNLLRKRVLIAMSKTDAERILSTPTAQEELRQHAGKAGPVGNVSVMAPMPSFRVGPQGAEADVAVASMPVNHEALARLLDDFNNERITDRVATDRFKDMALSLEDITGNMSAMQATDSQLFNAMIERIETLDVKPRDAGFPG